VRALSPLQAGRLRRTAGVGLGVAITTALLGLTCVSASAETQPRVESPSQLSGAPAATEEGQAWVAGSSLLIDSVPGETGQFTAAATRGYAFLSTSNGKPVRWNPCAPITYKINRNKAVPKAELAQIKKAFTQVGRALGGVTFVYRGSTAVVPDSVADTTAAKADVVLAFARPGSGPTRSAMLRGGRNLGMGGYATGGYTTGDGVHVPIARTGALVLDSHGFAALTRRQRSNLYLHELGHVVGLDHVGDRKQVMYPLVSKSSPAKYAAGDLAGLRRIGKSAGCLQLPARPGAPAFSLSGDTLVVTVPPVRSVSGKVRYSLSRNGEWQPLATSATPTFRVPLTSIYDGTANGVRFAVSATNAVGRVSGRAATYTFPKIALKSPSRLAFHRDGMAFTDPLAVLTGTTVAADSSTVAVTGLLHIVGTRTDGETVFTDAAAGSVSIPAGWGDVTEWVVTGSLSFRTSGSPERTVDYSGTYLPTD
jgi:matrixin